MHQIQDHSHYVQGVAWDPLDEYIATQSSDRCVALFFFFFLFVQPLKDYSIP